MGPFGITTGGAGAGWGASFSPSPNGNALTISTGIGTAFAAAAAFVPGCADGGPLVACGAGPGGGACASAVFLRIAVIRS